MRIMIFAVSLILVAQMVWAYNEYDCSFVGPANMNNPSYRNAKPCLDARSGDSNINVYQENSTQQYFPKIHDPAPCIGECGSEQGMCISWCNGNGQCIGNCASAHGRCVARCAR